MFRSTKSHFSILLRSATLSVAATTALLAASPAAFAQAESAPRPPVATGKQTLVASLADQIPDVAERAVKSVVSINTSTRVVDFDGFNFNQDAGLGSGVIVSANGRILTNFHVIERADDVIVALSDGREFPADIVGVDPRTDLAVLQLKGNFGKLTPMQVGDAENTRLGEVVLAIGNPFGVGQSVSMGIISAKHRDTGDPRIVIQDFLQTDAAINPGNSGGALINLRGELVGINTMIAGSASVGVGFAIPSSLFVPTMDMLVKDGKVTRGYLGVEPTTVTPMVARQRGLPVNRGVLIERSLPDGPAFHAGIGTGDIIVAINGEPMSNAKQVMRVIGTTKVGATVKVDVIRKGKKKSETVALTLAPFPDVAPPKVVPKVPRPVLPRP